MRFLRLAPAQETAGKIMSRWKAAGIHFAISLIVAVVVGSIIYFVWYPPPYFGVSGGGTLMLLIIGVDVMIGPFLTLAVFRSGKKSLKFDLMVIALLQIAAFWYGLTVISEARPVFIVMAIDRFVPVYADELSEEDLAAAKQPAFAQRSWTGPVLVGVKLPSDAKDRNDLVSHGFGGKDIEKFPKFYVSYAEVADAALARAKPLAALSEKSSHAKTVIDNYVSSKKLELADLVYLPLHGRETEYAMVLSRSAKSPVAALELDPW
jgi:hypothetical protein